MDRTQKMTRKRSGFTMTELVVTISIILLLFVVGVPGAVALRNNLKITGLDAVARTLYLSAQNTMVKIDAGEFSPEPTDPFMPETKPDDFPQTGEMSWQNDQGQYRYAQNGSATANLLLPLGSVDDAVRLGGYYYIEYNWQTSTVYGVFYSEEPFNYASVSTLADFRTNKGVRKGLMVGYYGGSGVKREEIKRCNTPEIFIENTDVLRLSITNFDPDYTVAVTVSDGTNTVTFDRAQLSADVANQTLTLLLDSLTEQHFRDICPELTPGADLTIRVEFSKEDWVSTSASARVNSLFADREQGVASVAYPRHLQNLDAAFSHVEEGVTNAVQTAAITWPEDVAYSSIANENLLSFNGCGLEVRSLHGENGLIRSASHLELENIRLVNPVIDSAGTDPVGVLAGSLAGGSTVTNCGVFVDVLNAGGDAIDYEKYPAYGLSSGNVGGGLIGSAADCTITGSFAALPRLSAPSGAGLIGSAENCTVSHSYAACDQLSAAALLLGGGTNTTVSDCYAVGNKNTEKADRDAVPFAGEAAVSNSYCAYSYLGAEEKKLHDPDYTVYDGDGSAKAVDSETLAASVTEDSALSAAQSHPYVAALDGKAFPYPGFADLEHYGSWPTDGMVEVAIKLLLATGEEGPDAGVVTVTDESQKDEDGNPKVIYKSDDKSKPEVLRVKRGSPLHVEVKAKDGYEYQSLQVDAQIYGSNVTSMTVTPDQDMEITATFRQQAFTLTCANVEYTQQLSSGGNYTVYLPGKIMNPGENGPVNTGSQIRVETSSTGNQTVYVSSVWYTKNGDNTRYPVERDVDGDFTFTMPSFDATLHVQFTNRTISCAVQCYVMDVNGEYQLEKTLPDRSYGVGEVIGENLLLLLADEADLALTISDGGLEEHVLHFASGDAAPNGGDPVFHMTLNEAGKTTEADSPYTTVNNDRNKTFNVRLYFARKQYTVTLVPGENISQVGFGSPTSEEAVSKTYYYGANVVIDANTEDGRSFTVWTSNTTKFLNSSNKRHSFQMPHFDLTLTASAQEDVYHVQLMLYEDGEAWLKSSASRQKKDVRVELVNTEDPTEVYLLQNSDSAENSYVSEGNVPAVRKQGQGYYIRVDGEYYTTSGAYYNGGEDDRVVVVVWSRPVTYDVLFYSVNYYPNLQEYTGTLPQEGTYLFNHLISVPGNTGALQTAEGEANNVFDGWKDVYAGADGEKLYYPGENFQVIRKTDFFAEWVSSHTVTYHANGGEGGELPSDHNMYQQGETAELQFGSLTRAGYTFVGWSVNADGSTLDYAVADYSEKVPQYTFTKLDGTLNLYAVWEADRYQISFFDENGQPLTDDAYPTEAGYGGTISLPGYNAAGFIGWAELSGGSVRYQQGETLTITGDREFHARVYNDTVTITFYERRNNGWRQCGAVTVGRNVPTYLYCSGKTDVAGWNTSQNLDGTFYPCDGEGRGLTAAAFSANTRLYAVTGKVYNYNRETWHSTLRDAVNNSNAGDTLVVYGDTTETGRITFSKNLDVTSVCDATISWANSFSSSGSEFSGCMTMQDCTVRFGETDVPGMELGAGKTLTFDANGRSRVLSLNSNAVFHMYDGVTLTNGRIGDSSQDWGNGNGSAAARANFGGGVYAGLGATFYMHGGAISHCSAVRGGGVWLYGQTGSQNGSNMVMGDMVTPTVYSPTAIYYTKAADGDYYVNVTDTVTPSNYKNYLITQGNPEICYNTATRNLGGNMDGGGGLLMLDLPNGHLKLYRGSIHNNAAPNSNGGGIMTDSANNGDYLRIYEVEISHNSAVDGGGLFQWQGTLFIYNSNIRQNYASGNGGGVYLRNSGQTCDIEFSSGDIAYNEAVGNGGAVYVEAGSGSYRSQMRMSGGNLYRNRSGYGGSNGRGGGVYLVCEGNRSGQFLLSGGSIFLNQGYSNGLVDDDIYMNGTANSGNLPLITVPAGRTLDLSHNSLAGGSKIVVDRGDAAENRVIVSYGTATAFRAADADEFVYHGDGTLSVVPDAANRVQKLGVSEDARTVTFNANGGTFSVTGTDTEKTYLVGAGVPLGDFPAVQRPGYVLAGWAASATAYPYEYVATAGEDGALTGSGYTVTSAHAAQVLYAMWEPAVLTYDVNTDYPGVSAPASVTAGDRYNIILRAPSVTSFTEGGKTWEFKGWAETADAAEPTHLRGQTYAIRSNVTLYAVWSRGDFLVSFQPGEGSGSMEPVSVKNSGTGLTVIAPACGFTRQGWAFAGWNTAADGSGIPYQEGESVPVSGDMTLYAQWVRAWTISFNFNGGGGSMDAIVVNNGESATLPDCTYTWSGYAFTAWNTAADGSGTTYQAGDTVTVSGDMILYAQWSPVSSSGIPGENTGSGTASGVSSKLLSKEAGS